MKSQTRLLLMLPVLAIAAWLALFGDKTPVDELEPVAAVSERRAEPAVAVQAPIQEEVLQAGQVRRMASRAGLLARAEAGVDIFAGQGAEPESVQPEVWQEQAPPPEQPFVLFGRILENGHWRFFLEQNGASYVAGVGDEVAGYRIVQASTSELRLTRKADKFGFVIPIDGEKKD